MNRVFLIGRATKDVEISKTNNDRSVAKFVIAVDRRFKNADGEKVADFINIVAWSKLAEICGKYIKKGKQVAVSGELQGRSYEVNGEKKFITEIIADEIELLGGSVGKEEKVDLELIDDDNGDTLPF